MISATSMTLSQRSTWMGNAIPRSWLQWSIAERPERRAFMKSFEGQVALVTGAGGGIGLAAASAFAEAGASVIMADSNAALLEEAASALRSAGHEVLAMTCDVRDRNQVRAMTEQAAKAYGRLDAAFNNAGINCDGAPMLETDDEEFDSILDVNLRGVWNCMKAELRQMMAQGSGAIVNCSSIGGMRGSKGRAAYSASKFGIIGLTRAVALDYAVHTARGRCGRMKIGTPYVRSRFA